MHTRLALLWQELWKLTQKCVRFVSRKRNTYRIFGGEVPWIAVIWKMD